jgi:hypothetical protein
MQIDAQLLNELLKALPESMSLTEVYNQRNPNPFPINKALEWDIRANRPNIDFLKELIRRNLTPLGQSYLEEAPVIGFSPENMASIMRSPNVGGVFVGTPPKQYSSLMPSGTIMLRDFIPEILMHELGHRIFGEQGIGNRGNLPSGTGRTFENWLLQYPPKVRDKERLAELFSLLDIAKTSSPTLREELGWYKTK